MSKRVADKQLTDQNWQEEEAEEEVGEFKKASDDVLKTRVIRTAKRRGAPASDAAPSAFAGFGGFGAKPANGNANGFGAPASKPSFSFGVKPTEAPKPSFSFGTKPVEAPVTSSTDLPPLKDEVFLKKLKKLNESVLKFAQDHVSKNPLVILTSVFEDYSRHLARIQGEKVVTQEASSTKEDVVEEVMSVTSLTEIKPTSTEETKEATPTKEASPKPASPGFKFETKEESKPAPVFGGFVASTAEKPSFSFGTAAAKPAFSFAPADSSTKPAFSFKPAESTTDAKPAFSFKPSAEASSTMPAFSFAAKPFTGFGTLGGAPAVPAPAAVAEEEEAPPVAEKTEHIEKDGLYHVKCKLFLKSGDGWNEKGVGIANLKECGEKVQLLIRNDTTMGTVVLNTLLHDKVPITHMGKNSLMIVVASAGEGDQAASTDTYLIRVKNKDVADTFYAELEKYKAGIPAAV